MQAISAKVHWAESLNLLETWLFNNHTSHQLTSAILDRLTAWHRETPFTPVEGPRALKEFITEQDAIGWENFLMGRISSKLAPYQQVHYTNLNKQRTGKVWASKLINQLWLIMWRMWEHRNKINKTTLTKQDYNNFQKLKQQARREFSKGTRGLRPMDHHLLEDKYEVLDYSLPDLKAWVDRMTNARDSYIRVQMRLKNTLKKSQKFMRDWQARAKPRA